MSRRRHWFEIRNAAPGGEAPAEIYLYDDIGMWGITANDFIAALNELGDVPSLNVRINSGGGSVMEGIAIFQALGRHPATKHVFVDSVAASIASLIAMAGDDITMFPTSMMMVHRASAGAAGTSDDMRQCADVLDMIDKMLAGVYAGKTGKSINEIMGMLTATTYMDAEQAVAMGFADRVDQQAEPGADPTPQNEIDQYIRSIASSNMRELLAASAHMPAWLRSAANHSDGPGRRDHGQEKGGDLMDPKELKAQLKETAGIDVDGLTNQVTVLTGERDTARTEATEAQNALQAVIGDRSPAEAQAAIAAGEDYRNGLVDEIVAGRRQLGLTADTDDAVNTAKAMLNGLSLDQLKAEATALSAQAAVKEQLNPEARQEDEKPGKRFRKTRKKTTQAAK